MADRVVRDRHGREVRIVSGLHNTTEPACCDFCGKDQSDVFKLITGPGVAICDERVDVCRQVIDEARAGR